MATKVDDKDYAHVVLICSGQFSDPDLKCRLTDITRQLHMLAAGANEPVVTSVEPWNSVRVTLKVSRQSAALLQTLAQQQDPKLLDIGILAVQVEGGNPVCVDRPMEVSFKVTAAGSRVNVDSSLRLTTNSSALGACQSAVHASLSQMALSTVSEVTCARAGSLTSNVNLSWHPLVDQRPAASGDDAGSSWDPFGYNGLSVDPFQFSADDLLTRMLADVPAPKRRQRMRKSSAASATQMPFRLSNPSSLGVLEDCSWKVRPSNEVHSVSHGTAFGIPAVTQSQALQKSSYFDKDRTAVGSSSQFSLPYSSQMNDLYSAHADNHSLSSVGSHPLYNHLKQNVSSATGMLPMSLDSLMTVSNHTVSSDQPPVKRRHVKLRNSAVGHSTVAMYSAVSELNQRSPIRDVCSEGTVSEAVAKTNVNAVKSAEMNLPGALESRYAVHSPRASWSDMRHCHRAMSAGYPNGNAYRFQLPCRQSFSRTQNSSSYMYSDMPVSHALPFVSDVRKPFSFASIGVSQPSFSASLPSHSVPAEVSLGTAWRPCHPQSFSSAELRHGSICDGSTGSAGYLLSSTTTTTCSSLTDQPGTGNRPSSVSSHVVRDSSETCSTMDYCGISASSVQPSGVAQTTSPRDGWACGDSDYGSASVTDSGIASNTSLSVGSDHSENDRGSVEMNTVEPAVSAKLSPVSAADRVCAPSSPPPVSSTDCLLEPPQDIVSVTSSCTVMRTNPHSAGQNGDFCIAANKHSAKPQSWLGDSSHSDSSKKSSSGSSAQMRFARRSRQTPTLSGECPPAITCPSLPRRLSESVKKAMRGGAATDPPMTTAPCDIVPTKVVIRITKTRCSGPGEARKSKQKEQWCVQPIVKQSSLQSDVANTYNGTIHCSVTNNTKELCTDIDSVSAAGSVDKFSHQREVDVSQHAAFDKRDLSQSSDCSGRLTDSVVAQIDQLPSDAQPVDTDGRAAGSNFGCSDQGVETPAVVSHGLAC